jgi:hypothetical protein
MSLGGACPTSKLKDMRRRRLGVSGALGGRGRGAASASAPGCPLATARGRARGRVRGGDRRAHTFATRDGESDSCKPRALRRVSMRALGLIGERQEDRRQWCRFTGGRRGTQLRAAGAPTAARGAGAEKERDAVESSGYQQQHVAQRRGTDRLLSRSCFGGTQCSLGCAGRSSPCPIAESTGEGRVGTEGQWKNTSSHGEVTTQSVG